MSAQFDIFSTEVDGGLRWVKAVPDVDMAVGEVEALGAFSPGRYIIHSQVTGKDFYLDVDSQGMAAVVSF
jgi:hypothetical protein